MKHFSIPQHWANIINQSVPTEYISYTLINHSVLIIHVWFNEVINDEDIINQNNLQCYYNYDYIALPLLVSPFMMIKYDDNY